MERASKRAPDITFEDVSFVVRNRKGKKTILKNISGYFPSGKLIGIFGPSGAGKSSLLNVLSGWDQHSKITGSITIDEKPRQLDAFKAISCYITQDSHLNDTLTTEENLTYATDLKLGSRVSQRTKHELTEQILDSFGLAEHRMTKAGRLSGGQRKRLAICLELISDPDILFLDEPTTGLDFVSTVQCMNYLKKLSTQSNTVICTLHQPPDQIIHLLDLVYIVADGQCAYQGTPADMVRFLADNGTPCEMFHSPLDYIIEIVSNDYGPKVIEILLASSENGKNRDYFLSPSTVGDNIEAMITCEYQPNPAKYISKWNNYTCYEDWYEFRTLMKREAVKLSRSVALTYMRFGSIFINSLLTGLICYNMGGDATLLYFNYNMVLLHIAYLCVGSCVFATTAMSLYRNVLNNEYQNGYYSIKNYFLTSIILDIPVLFVTTTFCATMLYWMTGQLWESQRVLIFATISFLLGMVGSAIGFLFGSVMSLNISLFAVTSMHIPLFVLSGFGMSIIDVPSYFRYLTYIPYTRYAVRTLMGVLFGYNRPPNHCPEDKPYCHYTDSKRFLDEMGLEDYYFIHDATVLCVMYVLVRALTLCFVRYRLVKGI